MAGFSMLGLSLLLAGVGTATQVVGQIKSGNAARRSGEAGQRAAESAAGISDYNAAVADLQASDALERGLEDESRYRSQVKGIMGAQRAGIAASGTDVNFGSAVDVQADAAFLGELDALTIRTNASREAWGYKVQATDYRMRAKVQREEGVALDAEGRSAQSASRWGAAGTIIGGGTSLLSARYGFGRASGGGTTSTGTLPSRRAPGLYSLPGAV